MKKSNLKLSMILLFLIVLLMSVYAVLSQENNTSDNVTATTSESIAQEEIVSITGNVVSEELLIQIIEISNQTDNTTNETINSASIIVEEGTKETTIDGIEKIMMTDKITEVTKELLKSNSGDESKKFIIKYNDDFDKSKLNAYGGVKSIEGIGVSKLDAKITDLSVVLDDDSVEYVELDQDLSLLYDFVPWNVERIGATTVRNISLGSGVKIAVLDTGISSHIDLSISGGWNVIDNDSDYFDFDGHGSAVAGVIGALINDQGLVGVSPNVSLYSVKIMNGSSGSLSDAIAGVLWAIDNDMDIISMSFGFSDYSQIFNDVLQDAYDNGILIVGASGNDGIDGVVYPASYDSVIAVGATDDNNYLASFSNYGFELELVAPGVNINSTFLDDGYSVVSGTSMAAPHVAGVAALVWSYNQSLSNVEVRAKLRNDAFDLGVIGRDDYYGYGLVQINLSSENYNYTPESYYYEIYNISNYGFDNESYVFWLSNNGTIDDVNFSIGYYLINKTINGNIFSQKIAVKENGTIIPLLFYPVYVNYIDNYTGEGTNTSDNIAWLNGKLDMYIDYGLNSDTIDGECFRYRDYPFDYEKCYFSSSTIRNACDTANSMITCSSQTSCAIGIYPGSTHDYIDTSTPKAYTGDSAFSSYQVNCAGGIANYNTDDNPDPVYIINQKRAHCLNSTHYTYQGWYGSGWVNYGGAKNCNSTCDDTGAINYTNPNDVILSPCEMTDLAIVSIIPIQVIPGVDMVKGKSGYVVVNVSNQGSIPADAFVRAWFDGEELDISYHTFAFSNDNPREIDAGTSALFVFSFKPLSSGTNKIINASVEVEN